MQLIGKIGPIEQRLFLTGTISLAGVDAARRRFGLVATA
jgi:hypothetical protein